MKRKISLSTLLILGALPLGTIAAEPAVPPAAKPPTTKSAGEFIDDVAITAKVKAAFIADKEVRATDIKVDTVKGNVQLSGFADSPAEIERAEQIVRDVAGVKSIQNDIRLK